MKKFTVIVLMSLMSLSLSAQENKKVAKIEFEQTTIDYGTIEKNADGLRVFKFKNTGDAPLIISYVRSSCGCTIPKKPEEPIMPGETGEIEVRYATNKPAPFRKTITVMSNADTPKVTLKIKGEVVEAKSPMEKEKSVLEQ
jgi:hypothetical protein